MSADIHAQIPGDPAPPVAPDAAAQDDAGRRGPRFGRAAVVRAVAHLAAWAPFVYAVVRALRDGWLPVSDSATIALRSWDVLSANSPLVGQATRLAHGAFDLGPLEYWLLALPVHLLSVQGVLVGGALWCMVAASVAIEAAWAAAGGLGTVLTSGMILGIVAWSPGIAMVPVWNPWFGMMFFIAALAAGWAVLSGRRKWWPALAITGSVAAQAHLMYAIAVVGLLLIAFVTVLADSRRTGTYRWAVTGVLVGLACWIAPLVQQFTGRPGNLTQLIAAEGSGGATQTGYGFGLKALAAATQPPVFWWKPALTSLTLDMIAHRAAWFGIAELVVTALMLSVAIFVLRSRRAAALAVLGLLTAASSLKTYSGIPASNLQHPPTDLSYLMVPIFLIGVLTWLATGYVVLLVLWRSQAVRRLVGDARTATGSWGPRIAGIAGALLLVALTARTEANIGGAYPNQAVARNAIRSASAAIERKMPPRRLALTVVAPNPNDERLVTLGLIYILRTKGYAPVSRAWVSQVPSYHYAGGPITHVTIVVPRSASSPVTVRY